MQQNQFSTCKHPGEYIELTTFRWTFININLDVSSCTFCLLSNDAKKRNMTEMVIVPEVSQGDDIFSSDFWIVNVVICRSIKASSYPEPWPGQQKHLAQAEIHSHMITSHWLVCSSYLVKYHSQLFSCDSNSAAAALVYSSSILSAQANWWINHQSSCDKNRVLSFNTGSRDSS